MIKIGILTFHRSINTGAFIQCYSLSQKLTHDFPSCKIEVIDYWTRGAYYKYAHSFKEYVWGESLYWAGENNYFELCCRIIKNIYHLLRNPQLLYWRKQEYRCFQQNMKFLPLSEYSLCSDNCEKFYDDIQGKYDIIIVGSDCVWQTNAYYPFPNVYFLKGIKDCIKISYAACALKIFPHVLNEKEKKYIYESLNEFCYLGVRDKMTENLLGYIEIDKKKIQHNCDPAFLLDMNSIPVDIQRLKRKLEDQGVDFNKKIIGLQVNAERIGEVVNKIKHDNNQVVAIRCENRYADVNIKNLTPLEWSRVFSLFDCTVTDFFHGTILSLKNGVYTLSFDIDDMLEDGETSRLEDLMRRLELEEHYIKIRSEELDKNINSIKEKLEVILDSKDTFSLRERIETEAGYYNCFKIQLESLISSFNRNDFDM